MEDGVLFTKQAISIQEAIEILQNPPLKDAVATPPKKPKAKLNRPFFLWQIVVARKASPYAGGVQVGSPEPPFKINDIHSMHVVEVLVYTHLFV